jgi:hypothetical protein
LERDYAKLFVGVLKIHEKFLRDILARARVAVKYFRNLFRLKAEIRSGIANSRELWISVYALSRRDCKGKTPISRRALHPATFSDSARLETRCNAAYRVPTQRGLRWKFR